MLHRRIPLLIHPEGNILHLFTPSSQSVPLPPPPFGNHKSILHSMIFFSMERFLFAIYYIPDINDIKKDTSTHMFIAALFKIAKTWNQPKCPLTDDWIRNMWYIYTRESYSAIKKNKIMPFAAIWMELEMLILREVSQKDKYHMISLISGI